MPNDAVCRLLWGGGSRGIVNLIRPPNSSEQPSKGPAWTPCTEAEAAGQGYFGAAITSLEEADTLAGGQDLLVVEALAGARQDLAAVEDGRAATVCKSQGQGQRERASARGPASERERERERRRKRARERERKRESER